MVICYLLCIQKVNTFYKLKVIFAIIIMQDVQTNNPDSLISGYSLMVNSIKASSTLSTTYLL